MEKLKILAENELGRGIIIDTPGYISHQIKQNSLLKEGFEKDENDDFYIYAILQKFDTPNKNGRIYPEHLLKREDKKFQDLISKNASLCELNHPPTSNIDLDRGCAYITETWWEGNTLLGKLKILTTKGWKDSGIISSKGDLVAHYLSHKVTLGISSRGIGTLKRINGKNLVQDDFELICYDVVASPSTPGAYLFHDLDDKNAHKESKIKTEKEENNQDSKEKVINSLKKFNNFFKN
jgi:hypothetical protein